MPAHEPTDTCRMRHTAPAITTGPLSSPCATPRPDTHHSALVCGLHRLASLQWTAHDLSHPTRPVINTMDDSQPLWPAQRHHYWLHCPLAMSAGSHCLAASLLARPAPRTTCLRQPLTHLGHQNRLHCPLSPPALITTAFTAHSSRHHCTASLSTHALITPPSQRSCGGSVTTSRRMI